MDYKELMNAPTNELLGKLRSSLLGLSQSEVELRLLKFGKNEVVSTKNSWFSILLRQFVSPFFYLLLIAFGVSLFLGEKLDAFMILTFVCINAILGFIQEYRSEQTLALLEKVIASKVRVMREGKELLIESILLVPGDIVILEPGDIIPADLRLLESYGLSVNESVLTGESIPTAKDALSNNQICFSGTEVVSGKAKGIVFATGNNTNYGDVARLASETKKQSTFEKELGRLSKFILVLVVITLLFVVGINSLVKDTFNLVEFLIFAIALSVSVIPEALPVVTTFSLSIGARHLAKRSVVVKRLSAIEDLGGIQILCSDKTGTLTENELAVVGMRTEDSEKLFLYAALSGSESLHSRNAGNNAFEVAIASELSKYKKALRLRSGFQKILEIPFDPMRRRTTALMENKVSHIVISRGAPEAILPLCNLTKEEKRQAMEWERERGLLGVRSLAVACKTNRGKAKMNSLNGQEEGMDLLGLIAFKDPIKKTTFDAIAKAKELGVQVKILTGDSPDVAAAVALDVGLIDDIEKVITGEIFEDMDSQTQHDAVLAYDVFARVTPQQKYKIIQLLQEHSEVGFLGEGINDAPALKIANVGMVVQSASDVAREAADIVLLDRSLRVIVDGIHEGRAVFANTSKYITTTLSSNFGNFFAVAIVSLVIDYLPMLPLQILLVNLLTDFPMISVATDTVDKSEVDSPKKYDLKSFAFLALTLGVTSTFFDFIFFAIFRTQGPSVLQTNWFIGSILTELIFIFSIRTRRFFMKAKFPSWTLLVLVIIAAEAAILFPYTGIGHNVFKFVSPTPQSLIIILGIVGGYFVTTETVKLMYYRMVGRQVVPKAEN